MPLSPVSPSTGSTRERSTAARSKTVGDRFLIGEELGKGAHGMVFKGIDLQNGDFVAVKQVSLEGMNQQDLASIMVEIDLLKNLRHKNIVKYLGSFKTKNHLYIFLEYAENGALAGIIKPSKFGAFPESLVAVYMGQVLEGLAYLHGQGVIHRDVKGANILITKEGLVKLADFGVATKLSDAELKEQSVVGTPYWMAPEVIEMAGVSAASDIWSVGCTAIELLTCSPPYYDLQPMTALFRIVRDDTIPLPEGISASLKDFLLLCFRKDPKLRPSAKELLSHPWLLSSRQKLSSRTMPDGIGQQTPNSVTQVVERLLEEENEELMASSAGPGEKIDDVLLAEGVVEVHVNGIAEKHAWKSQGTVAMVSQGVAAEPRKPGDSHVLHDVGTGPVQRMVDSMVHAPTFSLESWLQNMDSEKDSEICRLDSRFYAVSLTGHDEELSNLSSPMGHPSFDKESPVSVDIANNISHLKPDKQDGVLISCCQMLVQLFETKPDSKFLPVVNHIVVPIVELLEHSNHHVIVSVLKLANVASADNFKLRKKLCMCGILPRLLQFASSDLHEPLRIEVARFCQSMCSPSSGVEIFLAGNGAPILVELLKTNQETCCLQAADLALKTTKNVFQTHTALSILELCHLFSNLSLLNRLFESLGFLVLKWRELEGFAEDTRLSVLVQQSFKGQIAIASSNASDVTKVKSRKYSSYHNAKRSLSSIFSRKSKSASRSTVQHLETEVAPVSEVEDTLDDSQIVSEDCLQMIKGIAQLLLVFSHCDANVKIKYCEQENLHTLFAVIMCLPKDISCILVRSLKHLTLEASVLDQIQEVGAIPLLVSLLLIEENDWNLKKEALAALYNLCKVSKARQEEAAMAGAIPFLQTVVNTDGHMKQLAVPLLCGMVHASKATRAKLSALNILELYLRLLSDEQWNIAALEAVASWMAVDPSAVLHHLLKEKNVEKIVSTLEASSESGSGPFLHTLELLLRMLARSSRFNAALAISGLPAFIVSKLGYEDAIIKLQLLRLLRLVYQHHPEPKSLIYECGLEEKLQALVGEAGQDEPILVKQMAQTILDSLTINTVF